jgi:uncharacterized protein (DUF1697 family)
MGGQEEPVPDTKTYVAFLRGVNVGGNLLVKMDDLRGVFESLGFTNVRTVLASGNVVFDSAGPSGADLPSLIEGALSRRYDRKIDVLLRTQSDIQALVDSRPFKEVEANPQTRLYVTFLGHDSKKVTYRGPVGTKEGGFAILRVTDAEVCSAVTLSPEHHTTDLMKFLDREIGGNVTTRNWNTLLKILAR